MAASGEGYRSGGGREAPMWRCSCGKTHEDTFDSCWSCGRERGSEPATAVTTADLETPTPRPPRPGGRPRSGRSVTLKEETILNEWSTMVDSAGPHADRVLDSIQERLGDADIPGNCTWDVDEVKSSGWLSKVKREFLIVRLEQFSDYRMYISAREYGIHLDVCWFLTVEPGFFKRVISVQIGDSETAVSAPKNILVHQDLRAWVTVVHHAVVDAVKSLMEGLGQDKSLLRRESKGFLSVW